MTVNPLSPSVVEIDGPWSHELLHTRGVRLHAAVLGDPSAPLVLCIHGALGGWFDYMGVLEPLAAAGFRVAALDLRGYGLSDKPPVELGQDMRVLIGDIAGVIAALGHENAVLVGNDSGASLAWAVATERPERVRAVVSVSGAHPVDLRRAITARPWDFGWILARGAAVRLPMPLLQRTPRHLLVRTDARLNAQSVSDRVTAAVAWRDKGLRIGNTFRGAVWNQRLLAAPLRGSAKHRVASPVLFIHAKQGLWGPVLTRARRRADDITPLHIPGTKNLPHFEAPAEFAAAVAAWLRSL